MFWSLHNTYCCTKQRKKCVGYLPPLMRQESVRTKRQTSPLWPEYISKGLCWTLPRSWRRWYTPISAAWDRNSTSPSSCNHGISLTEQNTANINSHLDKSQKHADNCSVFIIYFSCQLQHESLKWDIVNNSLTWFSIWGQQPFCRSHDTSFELFLLSPLAGCEDICKDSKF